MPQFVNPYNGQNGMPTQQYPMNDQGYFNGNVRSPMMGNQPQLNVNQNAVGAAQQQGWRPYSPAPQMPPLVGRWVTNFEEIKPQDVPMDGSICFFPQADYSCIYAMVWSNDGKIVPYRFIPEKNDPPAAQQQALPGDINDILSGYEAIASNVSTRLTSLETKLNDIYNTLSSNAFHQKKSINKEEK